MSNGVELMTDSWLKEIRSTGSNEFGADLIMQYMNNKILKKN
ncbi:hypothetical protein QEW_3996 [Clostridioides difficile CD160]|nr:hypothetical protein QEW_3996 [Clostridioides difficile CD160]